MRAPRCTAACLSLLCVLSTTLFADDKPVFVAGFERFSRHDDISLETGGTLLVSELSCTACHASSNSLMLAKRGPVLDGVGNRVRRDWLLRFLESPSATKPGTTMPEVLTSLPVPERADAGEALAAYLSTLQVPFPDVKASGANPVPAEFWTKGDAANGRRLYHQIGCVACHAADESYDVVAVKPSPLDEMLDQLEPDELKELGLSGASRRFESVPFPQLPEKYSSESLTFFLLNPDHVRPSGRMPNFQLQPVDAADIAAWLLNHDNGRNRVVASNTAVQPLKNASTDAMHVERGRELFVQLRCINCHDVKGLSARPASKPFEQLDLMSENSCLGASENSSQADNRSHRNPGQPVFLVDPSQRNALSSARNSTETVDGLSLHLLQLNCHACHERNTLGGVGRDRKPYFETVGGIDIGDEGRLPPSLTGVGKRLTTNWMTTVLNGKGIIRPHMTIRMPVFPAQVTKPLPLMIAAADGANSKPIPAEQVFVHGDRTELVQAGRHLMDMGCVQCHVFQGESLPGVVGVDLEGVTQRLRADWIHDFLKDPGSLKARTRMPTFFPGGRSQNPDVLGGNTELQLAAMHAYLSDLANQPLPAKIEEARSKNYELMPVDRPIILRTFMPNAGTHAIAVGFPQKVHFAFDAENLRLAEIWRGRFLDAEGTWFVRSAPPASPLGDHRVSLPAGPTFARLENSEAPWPTVAGMPSQFRGYRLSKTGSPMLLYDIGPLDISDHVAAIDEHTLRRTITITTKAVNREQADRIWLRIASGIAKGEEVKSSTGAEADKTYHTITMSEGVSVTLLRSSSPSASDIGTLRTVGNTAEWLLPVSEARDIRVEIQYRW